MNREDYPWVYFAGDENDPFKNLSCIYVFKKEKSHMYKIGYTKNLLETWDTLNRISPMEIIAYFKCSSMNPMRKEVYRMLDAYRESGSWFYLYPECFVKLKEIGFYFETYEYIKDEQRAD